MRTLILAITLSVMPLSIFAQSSQTPQLSSVPVEAYGKLPTKSMVVISPNAERMAYRDTANDRDVMVVIEIADSKLVAAIDLSTVKPSHAYFIDNNKLLFGFSQNRTARGLIGTADFSAAYVYDLKAKNMHQLLTPNYGTSTRVIQNGKGKINTQFGKVWGISADKKYAYMPANVEMSEEERAKAINRSKSNPNNKAAIEKRERQNKAAIEKRERQNKWRNREQKKRGIKMSQGRAFTSCLAKVNLEQKDKPECILRTPSYTLNVFLDNKDKVLARVLYNNMNDMHYVQKWESGKWQTIFHEKTEIMHKSFSGVTPDYQNLVMISQDKKHGRFAYYTMSLEYGKISAPIFSHQDKDVEQVLMDINKVVYGVRYSGFTPTYEFFDEKLNARMRGINKAMPEYNIKITNFSPDWQAMVLYMDGDQSSGNYVLYQDGSLNLLATARPDIPAQAVHPVEAYSFNARDGLSIPSLLTTPRDISAKNLPAILLPHGGPESYDKLGFNWMPQYFASQGYVVIQPQFRGSKGFGVSHLMKGRGEWGAKMQNDLTDAVADLADKGIIDKNRVCIVGASYGGYAALAGAVFTPDLYQCVVSEAVNIVAMIYFNYAALFWLSLASSAGLFI